MILRYGYIRMIALQLCGGGDTGRGQELIAGSEMMKGKWKYLVGMLIVIALTVAAIFFFGFKQRYPKEINVHYSGGLSGHTDKDLHVWEENGHYYLEYVENGEQTELYELTEKEYGYCVQVPQERLDNAKTIYVSDDIRKSITCVYDNGNEITYPPESYAFCPYNELERMYQRKRRTQDPTPIQRIDEALEEYFQSAGIKNAVFYGGSQKEDIGTNTFSYYGEGFGTITEGRPVCDPEILELFVDEAMVQKLYDDGALASREKPQSIGKCRNIITRSSGQDYEIYKESFFTDPTLKRAMDPDNSSFMNVRSYIGFVFRYHNMISQDSRDFLKDNYFQYVEKDGRGAYVRTLAKHGQTVIMIYLPKEDCVMCAMFEKGRPGNIISPKIAVKDIMLSLGE